MPRRIQKLRLALKSYLENRSQKAYRYILDYEARFGREPVLVDTLHPYATGERLGGGSYGEVYKLCEKDDMTNCPRARKTFKNVTDRDLEFEAWTHLQATELYEDISVTKSDHNGVFSLDMPMFDTTLSAAVEAIVEAGHIQYRRKQRTHKLTLTDDHISTIINDLVSHTYTMIQNRFVHGDIKPDNIFLCVQDSGTDYATVQVVLGDLGTACWMDADGNEKHCGGRDPRGTVAYIPLDILDSGGGSYDILKYMDIWSVGVTLISVLWDMFHNKTEDKFDTSGIASRLTNPMALMRRFKRVGQVAMRNPCTLHTFRPARR